MNPRRSLLVLGSSFLFLLSSLVPPASHAVGKKSRQKTVDPDDLVIVDCLLPSRVRRLGSRNLYLTARQPIRTTAADCRIRGGEYTEPDQANYATSLDAWKPAAEAGDPEAQYYVGQIEEKGLGVVPDYAAAARWYGMAAEQGYAPAKIALAWLHEEGLGVARDVEQAFNLYRSAAGSAENLVVLEASELRALEGLRGEIAKREQTVQTLEREVAELENQLGQIRAAADSESSRAETLEGLVSRLRSELDSNQKELQKKAREVAELEKRATVSVEQVEAGSVFDPSALRFGSYHALVIGNSAYQHLPTVANAASDARKVAKTLEERYDFDVELLTDATRADVLRALNRLRESLTEKDNLLIYYAGHGTRDVDRSMAYWQPVDADAENKANWIPNGLLADHLDLMPARHVMVVADSEFTGLRSRSSVARLPVGQSEEKRAFWIRQLLDRRARLVLAPSGENGGASFTEAFLEVLENNEGVLEASRLHRQMSESLEATSNSVPEFASMRWARGGVSEFFFVRR